MEKIKQFIESEKGKDILIVTIVILVGLSSFELGRLSKTTDSSGIKILSATAGESGSKFIETEASALSATNFTKNISTTTNSAGKNFFASSRGKKYYSLGCSAGKSLKQENRVYFTTKEEAERAGYTLSSSCK